MTEVRICVQPSVLNGRWIFYIWAGPKVSSDIIAPTTFHRRDDAHSAALDFCKKQDWKVIETVLNDRKTKDFCHV